MKRIVCLAATLCLTSLAGGAAALTVTPTGDAGTLVGTILGPGISVVPGSASYTGAPGASGTFTGGAGSIGIASGVVLTTGSALGAEGPNGNPNDPPTPGTAGDESTSNGVAGDPDLDAIVFPSYTVDATVLEFQFTSGTGDLFFAFVFGSEEYNEYVGSQFNDVFAFFLDGVNIALIPGTSTPVSINTVNLGANAAYYNDNVVPSGPAPYDVEYDGFTDVLIAQALGIGAGTHTIKLAIGDAGDTLLDSGVFIQAGSFGGQKPPIIPEPGTLLLLGSGLLGLAGWGRRRSPGR